MPLNSPTDKARKPDAPGTLYVVGTPIGNMADITLRALDVLGKVGLIAAEDTRHTQRLLSHHGIGSQLISYHEHNEEKRAPELVARLMEGVDIALVSDAGTPTLSDPGYRLITAALESDIPVTPVPGVSAVTAALSVAGLPTDAFVFIGFPPKKKAKREKQLASLSRESRTLVFYESPRRIDILLGDILSILGDRQVVIAREMTKAFEEFIRGRISEVLPMLADRGQVKGECTLLIAGAGTEVVIDMDAVREEIGRELETGREPLGRISSRISEKFGISRQIAYAEGLKIKKGET